MLEADAVDANHENLTIGFLEGESAGIRSDDL
jgi:hypothetical protein